MQELQFVHLSARGVMKITGPETTAFLQGLVSGDVTHVTAEHAIWAAFLSPQGKYLFDFFIADLDGELVLDCEGERHKEFFKKLSMYKLKADVAVSLEDDNLAVLAAFGEGAGKALGLDENAGAAKSFGGGVAFVDPRIGDAGVRIIAPLDTALSALSDAGFTSAEFSAYEHLRIGLGLPDASRDMTIDRALLLENGFEELGGVSFEKGCYIGQEVTARTHYRGLVKKRLLPVSIEGGAVAPGTPLVLNDREVGEMKSSAGDIGLALIRTEYVDAQAHFQAGDAILTPTIPDWVKLHKPEAKP